ncbi:MAG TPA: AraC family transcriptional regulator [Povalibacter sp.]|nr:AraC family transcriptional regulator [Povalibacter sp.]
MSTLVRAAVLINYFEVAEHLHLDPAPLLEEVGLDRSVLADPEHRISLTAAIRLLEESARLTDCATFGLRMAETRQLAEFGAISLLLTHQHTLRDALHAMMLYQHVLNDSLAIHIENAGKMVVLREEVVTEAAHMSRQATELAIGVLFRLCATLLGPHWHPHSIGFTHAAPDNLQVHRRIFRCPLDFGAEFNGIVCLAADVDRPNPLADPQMARFAERFVASLPGVNKPSMLLDVRKAIYLALPMGRATIELVAYELEMNVRTVQRRLEETGHTFSDLVNDVRRELVQRYMENPRYPLSRIAELLGYSALSSFTRWFSSQFGTPPATWRATRTTEMAGEDSSSTMHSGD